MKMQQLTPDYGISEQIQPQDLATLTERGIKTLVCFRPDHESADQPTAAEIRDAAAQHGIAFEYIPVQPGNIEAWHSDEFTQRYPQLPKPILGYCRTGMRAASVWALANVDALPPADILHRAQQGGFDLRALLPRLLRHAKLTPRAYTVVIVGAGAAGIAVAASLLTRKPDLDVAIIDPAETHYYQPGWTMVGAGIFQAESTARAMASVLPARVTWIKEAVAGFDPEHHEVILQTGQAIRYQSLVVCPGLSLNWDAIEGLPEALGQHGVTSNYRYDLAPYTWQQVQRLKGGKAIFTQPPMPIKCAGAPQKAMYMSADYWRKLQPRLPISIAMYNAGGVLFGVKDYVPALMQYVERYGIQLNFNHQLVRVDGPRQRAWFKIVGQDQAPLVETDFDLLHAVPPQQAPAFIRTSPLTDAAGWVSVNQHTLQHTQYPDIFALGDVMNAPNAKTAAAARKQAPIVAMNVLAYLDGHEQFYCYDGYGSCPLTVERGKIVLAEFGYGGKLLPSFPKWLLDGQKPSRLAWLLKEQLLPPIYWQGMLKGREWLVKPDTPLIQERT